MQGGLGDNLHCCRVDSVDEHGDTPLMSAAVNGNVVLVNLLLEHGATVNDVDADGHTALWLASGQGNKPIVEVFPYPVCLCKHTHMHICMGKDIRLV